MSDGCVRDGCVNEGSGLAEDTGAFSPNSRSHRWKKAASSLVSAASLATGRTQLRNHRLSFAHMFGLAKRASSSRIAP